MTKVVNSLDVQPIAYSWSGPPTMDSRGVSRAKIGAAIPPPARRAAARRGSFDEMSCSTTVPISSTSFLRLNSALTCAGPFHPGHLQRAEDPWPVFIGEPLEVALPQENELLGLHPSARHSQIAACSRRSSPPVAWLERRALRKTSISVSINGPHSGSIERTATARAPPPIFSSESWKATSGEN